MQTASIMHAINRLSIQERMFIAEQTIHSIRIEENKSALQKAAEFMFEEYQIDKNLTAFTQLDIENFYETK